MLKSNESINYLLMSLSWVAKPRVGVGGGGGGGGGGGNGVN